MNNKKEYDAYSITKRDNHSDHPMPYVHDNQLADSYNEHGFAQIEIGEARFYQSITNDGPFISLSAVPQVISPRAIDPLREKFYAMRSLASGNPFARNDAGLFYKQARFMEDYTDNYQGNARFSMYYPYYQHMGYEQLRTFFTWRTHARNGKYLPICQSYVYLYIYELMSAIGVRSPSDGAQSLIAVWDAYRKSIPALDNYMPGWLKDYFIYYDLSYSFSDFARKHGLQAYYPEVFLFDKDTQGSLLLWNRLSSYDVLKSGFYNAGHEMVTQNCFQTVLTALQHLCVKYDIRIEDLFSPGINARFRWYPFRRALFYHRAPQRDRVVNIPGGGHYTCRNGCWTVDCIIHETGRKELIGYLIKKTEACLRQALKYKHKLTAVAGQMVYFADKGHLTFKELAETIENAVTAFCTDMRRTIVKVDHANLTRIRQEALGTQWKLSIPEDTDTSTAYGIRDDHDLDLALTDNAESVREEADGWLYLKDELSTVELKALSLILHEDAGIKAYADEHNLMLEVMMDGINEKAADYIGDSLISTDGAIAIYEDYKQSVREMVG